MNILNRQTAANDKDPFDQSDRDPWGPCAGKGDRDRSDRAAFKRGIADLRTTGPRLAPGDGFTQVNPGRIRKTYGERAVKAPRTHGLKIK